MDWGSWIMGSVTTGAVAYLVYRQQAAELKPLLHEVSVLLRSLEDRGFISIARDAEGAAIGCKLDVSANLTSSQNLNISDEQRGA